TCLPRYPPAMRLFSWVLLRLGPRSGQWIMAGLGAAVLLFLGLHLIPRYVDHYRASEGIAGTININHCTTHSGRGGTNRWSCEGSFHSLDGGTYIPSVTLDDGPGPDVRADVDAIRAVVSSAHASHAYSPGPPAFGDFVLIALLA